MRRKILRDEQLKRLGKRSSNVEIVAKTIASMTAIINPKTIVLTGESLDENMIEDIFLLCHEVIPEKHMPGILFCKEVDHYYLKGINALTQEKMNKF